jgi:hypothetical protein
MYCIYLIAPGSRPSSHDVAEHLWGQGCDYDSDGNADQPESVSWTELTAALRPDCEQRIDVDPLDDREPLVLVIRSEHEPLARRAAIFLQSSAGGELSDTAPPGRDGAL